jgi:putative oxidoreductase
MSKLVRCAAAAIALSLLATGAQAQSKYPSKPIRLLTPFAAGGVIGVMAVAWITAHRTNGFFIFRPGQGWEYVMVLLVCGLAVGAIGPGEWSLDDALDLADDLTGVAGLLIAGVAGGGGAAVLLATCWRPQRP